MSKIFIWNSGSKTLQNKDIAKTDKIRFSIKYGIIYEAKISCISRSVTLQKIKIKENNLFFYFDFLDKYDGCLIEIIYSGHKYINIHGTIKGYSNKIININDICNRIMPLCDTASLCTLISIGLISILLNKYILLEPLIYIYSSINDYIAISILTICIILIFLITLYKIYKRKLLLKPSFFNLKKF